MSGFDWQCLWASSFPSQAPLAQQARWITRYAVTAPSSHNTQPWLFRWHDNALHVHADESRWLRVADDDRRELYLSLGCAIENLMVAAEQFELGPRLTLLPCQDPASLVATLRFDASPKRSAFRPTTLFDNIATRFTVHGNHEARPIPDEVLRGLGDLSVEPDVVLEFNREADFHAAIDRLVNQADALVFADPEYRAELAEWIGRGVFGTPWLLSKLASLAVAHCNLGGLIARSDTKHVDSSPVLAILATIGDSIETRIRAGMVYQRLSLAAASHGIPFQPLSQIVQIDSLKHALAKLQPDPTLVPQIPFRMGYAAASERRTPRRDLDEVWLES